MNGIFLRLYLRENDRHGGRMVSDAIMRHANKKNLGGCSVFKAIAGFGSHQLVHEGQQAFELNAVQTVRMDFLLTDAQSSQLIDWTREQGFHLFYTTAPAAFGTINPKD